MKYLTLILSVATALMAHVQALDFGDHSSSTITTKAWESFNAGKHEDAIGYAKKCVDLYQAKARIKALEFGTLK